ncbi:MAG: AAA family ATPase, partial [Pseudomonadota bacterium]
MYTKYYGLTRKPFENTPDPNFLYLSREHREVLASLVYGVNSAKGLILAMGDVGTGKTTLINALQKQLDPSFVSVRITNPRLVFGRSTFTNILEYFATELGLLWDTTNNRDLIEAVTDELETLDRSGRRAVLIIDEAHLLSEESLHDIRLLSNIENEKTKLIQILLIGQNELNRKLQEDSLKALKQRFNITRRLMPLDKSETTGYIMHRLRVAGGDSQIFDKKALSLIFKKSWGVPRMINQICDSSLLIGYAVEARSIGSRVVKEAINDMNTVYKPEKTRSTFFFHEWRWPTTLTTAALLIILVAAILVFNRSFFTRDWGPRNEPVFDRTETLMEKHGADSQAKYLVRGDIKPIDGGVSGLDNEKGSLQGKTERTNRYPIPARNREPFFEVIESLGPEDEEFKSQRYLSKATDADERGKNELKGSTGAGLERDSTGGPLSGEETVLNQDAGVEEGYYKVRKGDTPSKIAGRKD